MAKGNSTLHRAKRDKNDEFYTRLTDIEKECWNYRPYFKGKTIFLNCDDPEWSEFWRYFDLNFEFFGVKRVISTHFDKDKPTYKLETYRDAAGRKRTKKTALRQNGDFRSPECVELLKEADIVVTNPPFSLLREYISQLVEYDKKFIVVGTQNAITYKDVFALIVANKVWLGCTKPPEFKTPDGSMKKFGNACWFTNLPHKRRREELRMWRYFDEALYARYDNYDAIDVPKVRDIPQDYEGVMGVPITFLEKYNPEQFAIVRFRKGDDDKDLSIQGKCPYFRILIKARKLTKKQVKE
jgi:hypothetical protein